MDYKISVCIATYNGDRYIKDQLNSILPQLSQDDEIIISDDHSKDNTVRKIESLNDNRIKIFFNSQHKRGYSKNFENAISKANGDIIFISDQDDVWMDNKVEVMVENLQKAELVISNAEVVDEDLNIIHKSHFEKYNTRQGFLINLLKTRYIGACMAFKSSILKKAMPFPDKQHLCPYDGWIANICGLFYKVKLSKEPLIRYRRHDENASPGGGKSENSFLKKISMRLYMMWHLINRFES